jgi:hypothetical protein
MRLFVPFVIALALALALALGCGKSATTDAAKSPPDLKAILTEQPIDKPAFETAVLGRSTREIAERLGTPTQVLNWEQRTGWVYRIRPNDPDAWPKVFLFFRDDRVIEVNWVD